MTKPLRFQLDGYIKVCCEACSVCERVCGRKVSMLISTSVYRYKLKILKQSGLLSSPSALVCMVLKLHSQEGRNMGMEDVHKCIVFYTQFTHLYTL